MPDKVITKFRSFYGPYADCPSIVTAVKELSDISYAFESTRENSVSRCHRQSYVWKT